MMSNVQSPSLEDERAASIWAEDDTLAVAARQDPTVFAELYRRHLDRVYRYLLARVGDTYLAQDLTAQTFLAALEGIDCYRGPDRFVAWLLTIASNKVADHFRRNQRRASVPLEAAIGLAASEPPLEHLIDTKLRLEQVARVLRALSPDRAEALSLRIFSGLSVAEVGRVMGKSEASVKMLIHRAIRDLQERLAFSFETEP